MGFKGPIGYTVEFIKNQIDKSKAGDAAPAEGGPAPAPKGDAVSLEPAAPQRKEPPAQPAAPAATAASPKQPAEEGGFKGPIGYTVEFIKNQMDKGKAPADGSSAEGKDGFDNVPLDEEAIGKAGSPEQSGVPRDPANARSKRLATRAIMIMGFALAVDFTMSLMSIQPLYYVLDGPEHVYGLTFGSYDLTAMLFAPLFGYWTDLTGTFKKQIVVGAVVNAIGNLLYGFVYLADAWWLMLVARAIAGVGAATLGIGSSYVTQTTTSARRQIVLGWYRISQNVARMVGPFVGYLFLGLPNVNHGSSTGLKLFNWYTIPGWAAFALVSVVLGLFVWWFRDPTDENEHRVHPDDPMTQGPPSPERIARFRAFTLGWLLLSFLTIFSFSGFTANLFALFAGQYHQVTNQGENWRTYIGIGAGAATSAWTFRVMIKWIPHWWEERKLCLLSNLLLLVTWLLVIPYGGSTSIPSDVLFYASTAIAGFTVVINQASLETVYSKKVTQYADVVGGKIGRYMGAYFMASSAGRFAGPLVVAGVTRMATPSGETNYCTDWVTEPDGSFSCNGPPDQQCVITGDQYYIFGCVLYNVIPMYAVMAALQAAIGVGLVVLLWKNWSYENEGPAAAAADAKEAEPSATTPAS